MGNRVRERRLELSLSRSAAARAAGIDRNTWNAMEDGRRETQEINHAKIERVLGWRPGSLEMVKRGGEPALTDGGQPKSEPLDDGAVVLVEGYRVADPALRAALLALAERAIREQRQ